MIPFDFMLTFPSHHPYNVADLTEDAANGKSFATYSRCHHRACCSVPAVSPVDLCAGTWPGGAASAPPGRRVSFRTRRNNMNSRLKFLLLTVAAVALLGLSISGGAWPRDAAQ